MKFQPIFYFCFLFYFNDAFTEKSGGETGVRGPDLGLYSRFILALRDELGVRVILWSLVIMPAGRPTSQLLHSVDLGVK